MSNIPAFDQLKRAQRLALISIASGDSPSQAAAAARVTDRTIRNWRKLPVFQQAPFEARRDFFSSCRSHVNASLIVAFEAWFTLLASPSATANDSKQPSPYSTASPTPKFPPNRSSKAISRCNQTTYS